MLTNLDKGRRDSKELRELAQWRARDFRHGVFHARVHLACNHAADIV
jgi:hypothetical protein